MRRVAGYMFGFMKQQAPEGRRREQRRRGRRAMSTWPERPVAHSITATDDEIRKAVSEAEVPPLLPALAYLTGDLSLLRDDLRPDPLLLAMEQGGLTEEQLATARELAVDDADQVPRRRFRARASPERRRAAQDHGVRRRRHGDGRVPPAARRGARVSGRGPPSAGVARRL